MLGMESIPELLNTVLPWSSMEVVAGQARVHSMEDVAAVQAHCNATLEYKGFTLDQVSGIDAILTSDKPSFFGNTGPQYLGDCPDLCAAFEDQCLTGKFPGLLEVKIFVRSAAAAKPMLTNVVDFQGSTSGIFCNSRIRHVDSDGNTTFCDGDFDRDLEDAFPGEDWDAHTRQEKSIEHSTWLSFWRGKVSGGIAGALASMQTFEDSDTSRNRCEFLLHVAQVPWFQQGNASTVEGINTGQNSKLRVLVMLSVDGGPVTQVEKKHLGTIASDVLSDLRRRKYSWASECKIIWAHFPSLHDLVESLQGQRNLYVDEDLERCFARDQTGMSLTLKTVVPQREAAPEHKRLLNPDFLAQVAEKIMKPFDADSVREAIMCNDVGTLEFMGEKLQHLDEEEHPFHVPMLDVSGEAMVPPVQLAIAMCKLEATKVLVKFGADLHYGGALQSLLLGAFGGHGDPLRLSEFLGYLFDNDILPTSDVVIMGMAVLDVIALILHDANSDKDLATIVGLRNKESKEKVNTALQAALDVTLDKVKEIGADAGIIATFREYDTDGDGCISRDEMHHMFAAMGNEMSTEQIDALFDAADSDGSGTLDFAEFFEWLTQDDQKVVAIRYKTQERPKEEGSEARDATGGDLMAMASVAGGAMQNMVAKNDCQQQ